jgi:PAS domain S-box-containing protein
MSSPAYGTDQILRLTGNDQRFRSFLDALSEFIAELTPEGMLVYANRTLLEATGLDLHEVIGQEFWQVPLWSSRASADSIRALVSCCAAGEQGRIELPLLNRDGRAIDTELSMRPIRDSGGLVMGLLVCGVDISRRKRAEQKIVAGDRYLRQMLDALFGFVGIFTVDGVIVDVNQAPLQMAGVTREEVIGKFLWETYSWSHDSQVQAELRDVMARAAAGEVVRYVTSVRAIGGRIIDADTTFGPLRSADGAVTGIVGFGVDITESRRAENAPRESEERLRLVIRGTNDGIWDWNVATGENYFSPRWKAILGYEDNELPHREDTFFSLLHPDDHAAVKDAVQRHFDGRAPFYVESRLRHKNGSYRWVLSRGEAVRDDHGLPVRMVGSMTDVTDHKLADQALFQREEQLRQAISVSKLGVFDHDHLANTFYWSAGLREIYGIRADQPGSLELFFSLVHPEDHDTITAAVRCAHDPTGNGLFGVEHRLLRPEGERWVATRAQTLFQGSGSARQAVRTVGACLDITERKLAERQIAASNQQLQTALDNVKELRGIISICLSCKKVRSDANFWESVEAYISKRTDAMFSHGLCPDCVPIFESKYGEGI